jgi:hypothetical protein
LKTPLPGAKSQFGQNCFATLPEFRLEIRIEIRIKGVYNTNRRR